MELESSLISKLRAAESSINSIVLSACGLNDVLAPYNDFARNDLDRNYSSFGSSESMVELLSYSIGCILGRYSLDQQGIVYAHSGNEGFDKLVAEGAYKTFPADEDGIIPLTDQEWFKDDATNRFREFVQVVWGEEHLQENLDFVAETLCLNAIKPKNLNQRWRRFAVIYRLSSIKTT